MGDFLSELLLRAPVTATMGILGAVVSFFVTMGLSQWWHKRLRRELLQNIEKAHQLYGQRQVVLVLSVREDIRQAGLDYLKRLGMDNLPLFQVHQTQGFSTGGDDWFAYLERVKGEVRKIREVGATRVYLFTNIPVALALLAGATLSNGPEVIIHHYQNGYHPIGRLAVDTVRL